MKTIEMTKEEFQKYLNKRKWMHDYHYCTKVIEFKVDDVVVAKVEYDVIRNKNKVFILDNNDIVTFNRKRGAKC